MADKSPLERAVDQFAKQETRDMVLRIVHAAASHAMVLTMTEAGPTANKEKLASDAQAYSRIIVEVNKLIGSPVASVPQVRVRDVQPGQMPPGA